MTTSSQRLERRYRRLLAFYPRARRDVYAEEMIAVLMSSASPNQSRPDPAEAVNLIASGLLARLRTSAAGPSAAGRQAAATFGLLGAIVAAVLATLRLTVAQFNLDSVPAQLTPTGVALAAAWALIAAAAWFGTRHVVAARLAAAGGLAAAAVQTATVCYTYTYRPTIFVAQWWMAVFAVMVAGALVAAAGRSRTASAEASGAAAAGPGGLGRFAPLAVAAAGVLLAIAPIIDKPTDHGPHNSSVRLLLPQVLPRAAFGAGPVTAGALLLFLITLAVVVLRLRPAVRRRVVVLALPVIAAIVLVAEAFSGFIWTQDGTGVPLVGAQWTALIAVPLVVLVFGGWLLGRYERKLASGVLMA